MKLSVKVVEGVDVLTPHGMIFGGNETDELQNKIKDLG